MKSAPAGPKKKQKSYHHGDLRNTLINSALFILARDGVHSLSLREVARSANVSHAAPYRHFKDKESLVAAIAEQGFLRLSRYMMEEMSNHAGDFRKQFEAAGFGYVKFARENPEHVKIMFGSHISCPGDHPDLEKAGRSSFMILVDSIKRCQERQIIKKGDPMKIAISAWSLTHGLALLLIENQLPEMNRSKTEDFKKSVTSILKNLFDGVKN